ncbi:unnamed protein product [Boreogadus saida]
MEFVFNSLPRTMANGGGKEGGREIEEGGKEREEDKGDGPRRTELPAVDGGLLWRVYNGSRPAGSVVCVCLVSASVLTAKKHVPLTKTSQGVGGLKQYRDGFSCCCAPLFVLMRPIHANVTWRNV